MALFDTFALRPVVGIHRELRRLNDSIDAVLFHFGIPSKKEALAAIEEARRAAAEAEKNPSILDVPTPLQEAISDLQRRHAAGETIDDDELLAAHRALEEDEEMSSSVW